MPIDLRYDPRAPWARFGIVLWWVLFLGGAGWTWLAWREFQQGYGATHPGPLAVVWAAGVAPFFCLILLRWIVTGRWLLTP